MSVHCEIAKRYEIRGDRWELMEPAERQFFCLTMQARAAQELAGRVELAMIPPTSVYVSPARKLANGNYELGASVLVQRLLPTSCPQCHVVHHYENDTRINERCVAWKAGAGPAAQHMVIEVLKVPEGV